MPNKIIFPPSNLGPGSPWARKVEDLLREMDRVGKRNDGSAARGQQGSASTLSGLQKQISELRKIADEQAQILVQQGYTLQDIENIQADQAELQKVYYNEFNNPSGVGDFIGFYPNTTPSVNLTSKTGRIEINYGGSLNGGNGYFCYSVVSATDPSIVWVDRAIILANAAQRVAISGGASFTPSGYRSTIVDIPANVELTVRLQLWAENRGVYFFGGSLLVRVSP